LTVLNKPFRTPGSSGFGWRKKAAGSVENRWVERRPLPKTDAWFETAWAAFKKGDIYH
jgi:hypothetical protein